MSVNPKEYEKFLGHTFVTRQNQVAFQVGSQGWTRWELANVFGIANFRAAGTLTTFLREAKIKTLEQLYALHPEELAAIPGIGETGAYVAASILKENSFDAKHWAGYAKGGPEPITFRTMKIRNKEQKRARRRARTETKHGRTNGSVATVGN